jgi:hypothetical protein
MFIQTRRSAAAPTVSLLVARGESASPHRGLIRGWHVGMLPIAPGAVCSQW